MVDDKQLTEEQLTALFKRVPQEELPEGFAFGMRQKLRDEFENPEQEEKRPDTSWQDIFLGFTRRSTLALAGAAMLLMFIAGQIYFKQPGSISVTLYGNRSSNIAVGQVALLRVEFRAARDIEDVTFRVELPEGVKFVSAHEVIANSKALAFRGDVHKKRSIVLPVAVRVEQAGRLPIRVEATKLGKKKIILEGRAAVE
jgi:hypothetical protein